jgi:hypothetical protein
VFRPTHVVPPRGLPAWEAPDPARPTAPLDAFLPVALAERSGDWGRIVCSNGWSAWVDARLLVAVPAEPPPPGASLGRTSDPGPLLARAQESLGRYRQAVRDLTEGRADGEAFRRRTSGLRVGLVVDGEAVWLYDVERARWVYCDGAGVGVYAVSGGPGAVGPDGAGPVAPVHREAAGPSGPGGGAPWAVEVTGPGNGLPDAPVVPGEQARPTDPGRPEPTAPGAPPGNAPTWVVDSARESARGDA